MAIKTCTNKSTESEAIQLEKKLKNLNRERLEAFILKYRSSQDD
jgi:predicted GIY-YIG superfamily endonuclease